MISTAQRISIWIALLLVACGDSSIRQQIRDDDGTGGVRPPEMVGAQQWLGSWAAAPYGPYPLGPLNGNLPNLPVPPTTFFINNEARNQSFRMMVHPTLGGSTLRVRFSNLKGTQPLTISAANVALRLAPFLAAIDTPVPLRFGGQASVTIPVGAEAVSDAADLSFAPGDDLAISFHLPGPSGPMTWHAVSFASSYVAPPNTGDTSAETTGAAFTQLTIGWFFISGVDVLGPLEGGTIVALGDSITDGTFSTPDQNDRWPDLLARRLQAANIPYGVLNQGINSNTVVTPREANAGDPAVQRFERDVLQRSGVRTLIVLEGTNDIGFANAKAGPVFAGLTQIAQRARAAGLCVVVATLLPRNDPPGLFGWDAATDGPERLAYNAAIRSSPDFDTVVDWARTMESSPGSEQPNPMLFVEGLHPNPLGFERMADALVLADLLPPPHGRCGARRE